MKNFIQFYLNNREKVIRFEQDGAFSPLSSFLDYLRNEAGLKGTKEGCGAGECGACTICLAEKTEGKVSFLAVNSCLLLLPMVDGKSLFTIEYLSENGKIHPIQRAMFEKRGVQCGFCSPGMIMSAYAHYRSGRPFTRPAIETALSGNLCRCTGYESIMQAMLYVGELEHVEEEAPRFPAADPEDLVIEKDGVTYFKPATLEKALLLLRDHPEVRILSGCTDLKVELNKGKVRQNMFLDLSDLAGLKTFCSDGRTLTLGSGVSVENLRHHIAAAYPAAAAYLDNFASLQIRNKATLGGSLSTSSPVGDIMPLLLALDAELTLASWQQTRVIPAHEFNLAYRKNALHPDEILRSVHIPVRGKDFYLYCHKQSNRKNLDISTMTLCLGFQMKGQQIERVRSGLGAMDAVPRGSLPMEEYLKGRTFTPEHLEAAAELAVQDFHPLSDVRGSAAYRLKIMKNLFVKVYEEYQSSRSKGL